MLTCTRFSSAVTSTLILKVMNEVTGSWLSGTQSVLKSTSAYPGEKFGAPRSGPGAMAGLVRRAAAMAIDWLLVYLPSYGILGVDGRWILGGSASTTLILWALLSIVSVILFSRTPGMAVLGLAVGRVDAEAGVGIWRPIVRTVLSMTIFPVLFQDEDSRGLHDQATGTAVVLTR